MLTSIFWMRPRLNSVPEHGVIRTAQCTVTPTSTTNSTSAEAERDQQQLRDVFGRPVLFERRKTCQGLAPLF